jgi:hypothetical protein
VHKSQVYIPPSSDGMWVLHTGQYMLFFKCHTEPVRLTEHLRGTRKSGPKKKVCVYRCSRQAPQAAHRWPLRSRGRGALQSCACGSAASCPVIGACAAGVHLRTVPQHPLLFCLWCMHLESKGSAVDRHSVTMHRLLVRKNLQLYLLKAEIAGLRHL